MSDNTRFLFWALAGMAGMIALAGLSMLVIRSIRYRVTKTHLKVILLGVPIRRVRLDNIRHIGNKPVRWAERWASAPFDVGRLLVVRRKRGLFKNFVITPSRPYEFRFALFQAIKALTGEALRETEWRTPEPQAGGAPPDRPEAVPSSSDSSSN